MCGIGGIWDRLSQPVQNLENRLALINRLQEHRGPDGEGHWVHPSRAIGFAHRRLSIIDHKTGGQPMRSASGNWITYNGEIYNYLELRQELGPENFTTTSDTETILKAYEKWGVDCVTHLRGMFAFAIWDEKKGRLFCARDRFGIKPFVYAFCGDSLVFASEAKALLPFLPEVTIDPEGFKEYLTFQFCLEGKTLFKNVSELPAAHILIAEKGRVQTQRYWSVYYRPRLDTSARQVEERLRSLVNESIELHMRSDVPVGAYVSGGIDSSAVAGLASGLETDEFIGFTGKFSRHGKAFDESRFARMCAENFGFNLLEMDIRCSDFVRNMENLIHYMDWPVAGPGSFPQYMVSSLAAKHRKVVLGGQGGDEIFGGYVRYLVAYFEQCIKAAIDGTMDEKIFVVTYESIIPNLKSLANYKPMLKEFWREGLFEDMDKRYFRLIDKSIGLGPEIRWEMLKDYSPYETFRGIFYGPNVPKQSYLDLMTHFDFTTLLPALLHVEDRMSMAHGLESRVPLLDHHLVEYAATIPSIIKFKNGDMKHALKNALRPILPKEIVDRQDKMGFPTPLVEWIKTDARDFIMDIFSSASAQSRSLVDNARVCENIDKEPEFGRKIWGLLCLELWQQRFCDRQGEFQKMLDKPA